MNIDVCEYEHRMLYISLKCKNVHVVQVGQLWKSPAEVVGVVQSPEKAALGVLKKY